jgi:outer membrane cobalamin receptor
MILQPPRTVHLQRLSVAYYLLSLVLGQSLIANGQEPDTTLETITVTGSRVPKPESQTGSFTNIDLQTIETRNASNVFGLIRDVPGVHVHLPGGRGNLGSIFIRGSEPNYSAVLVDGIQVNDPTNSRGGSFDFSTLNIDSVERVEIIRGPQSSIYGSDALSGAINLITHSGTDPLTAGVDIEVGSRDYSRTGLQLKGPASRNGHYALWMGGINEGGSSDPAEFQSRSLTGKYTFSTDELPRLSTYVRHSSADSKAYPDDSGGERLAMNRQRNHRETENSSLGFDTEARITQRTSLHVAGSLFEHHEQVFSPAVAKGIRNEIPENAGVAKFSRNTLNVFFTTELSDSLYAAYGIGYQEEDGIGSSLITLGPEAVVPASYQLQRDNLGTYGEIDYRITGRLKFDAAIRVDQTENGGTVNTGKVTLAYDIPDLPARAHFSWGEGFKLPSLFALGDPLVGNPSLEAESANSWELGLHSVHIQGQLQWRFAAFDQSFSNLIDFDSASFRIVNRSRVDIDGFELSADYRAGERWLLSAHATRLEIDMLDTNVRLRQRPESTGGLGVEWTPSKAWRAYLGLHYVGHRLDSSVPTGEIRLPSYQSIDLTFNYQLKQNLDLSFAIDNLTDEFFEPAIGFPALGRGIRVSIRSTLGRT